MFIETLKLLASNSDIQIEILTNDVVVTDEIALLYEDIYILFTGNFYKSYDNITKLKAKEIDLLFCDMTQDMLLWDNAALHKSIKWQNVRDAARELLVYLHEQITLPNLFWVTYIIPKGKEDI